MYEHLNETLSLLCMFYPDEALQRLEEVSYLVKNKDTKNIDEFLKLHDKRCYSAPNKAVAKASNKAVDVVKKMFEVSNECQLYYLKLGRRISHQRKKRRRRTRRASRPKRTDRFHA